MKKLFALLLTLAFGLMLLAGCSVAPSSQIASSVPVSESAAQVARTTFRMAGLKGPTTIGMVNLMAEAQAGTARHDYQMTMYGAADEIAPLLIKGEIDIALVPCNLASILYNKTQGAVQVAAINTLGVLYVLDTNGEVQTVADLKGKTIYATGKGATPEYVLNYILAQNGLAVGKDVTVEYKSEAAEVLSAMQLSSGSPIAMLPQPYVTTVLAQMETARVALDLTAEWNKVSGGNELVTGVALVRKDFAAQNADALAQWLEDYAASVEKCTTELSATAELVVQYGIIPKAPIAEKAIPACNIVLITGDAMKQSVSNYLSVLHAQNPEAVGGQLPDDAFYLAP